MMEKTSKCRMRLLSVLLFCCILFLVNALAEEFTIRNGLKWGDSPETVLESEEKTYYDNNLTNDLLDASIERKVIDNAMVGGHSAKAIFGFKNGKLACVEYDMSSLYFAEILSSLEAKYGRPYAYNYDSIFRTPIFECARNMYSQFFGDFNGMMMAVRLDHWWVLDDGTIIAAASDHMYEYNPYVVYIDSSAFASVHDFSGL